MRYSKDANHNSIIDDLKLYGVWVLDCARFGDGISDSITWFQNKTVFIEIKFGKKAEFKRSQLVFMSMCRAYVGYVKNFEEALNLARYPEQYALDQSRKDKIAGFLKRWDGKRILVSTFEKEIFKGTIK